MENSAYSMSGACPMAGAALREIQGKA